MQYLRKLREVNEDFIVIKYFLKGTSEHILFSFLLRSDFLPFVLYSFYSC